MYLCFNEIDTWVHEIGSIQKYHWILKMCGYVEEMPNRESGKLQWSIQPSLLSLALASTTLLADMMGELYLCVFGT